MVFMHMTPPDLVGLIPAAIALIGTGVAIGSMWVYRSWLKKAR